MHIKYTASIKVNSTRIASFGVLQVINVWPSERLPVLYKEK
jgi:hypothetical protein